MAVRFIINLLLLAVIVGGIYYLVINVQNPSSILSHGLNITTTQAANLSYPTTTIRPNIIPQNEAVAYALSLINKDRQAFGLQNVTYANETSGQQHSESMLQNDYFSHWDIYGMKPYMRYTLLGGNQSVQENVAFVSNSSGINVTQELQQMEYNMMYNDQACCNNGHRYNILNPLHNQVSIGIAYNSTTIFFTEDFINNYVNWFDNTPSYNNGNVQLKGQVIGSYPLKNVEVTYDPPVTNLTRAQLGASPYNSDYGNGKNVAGIAYTVGNERFYYSGVMNLNATTYAVQGNKFDVEFNMHNLTNTYGPGEYTVVLIGNYTRNQSVQFVMSTYTIFINSSLAAFTPKNI